MWIWNGVDFGDGFEGLIFEEGFFVDWFEEEGVDNGANDLGADFVEVLVCEEFGEKCEGLLGVVASEVIDLLNDIFKEFG